jgi:hypothetical protein
MTPSHDPRSLSWVARRLYPLRQTTDPPSARQPPGRSPATTCRHTRADRRAPRLRQTILLPAHPLLQHPPFPRPWCAPPNRVPCVPAARTGGPTSIHQSRPLSPPGRFRTRLRIPPSLSGRNIKSGPAYRSPGPCNTRLVARISNTDASYCTQLADPVDLPAKPRAFGRYELCHTRSASVWTGPIMSDTAIPG